MYKENTKKQQRENSFERNMKSYCRVAAAAVVVARLCHRIGERLAFARNRAHRCASAESEATCRLGRRLVVRLRLRLRLRLGRAGGLKARGYAKHRRSEPLLLLRQLDVVVDQTRCPQLVEQQCSVDLEQLARTLAQPVRVSRWLA